MEEEEPVTTGNKKSGGKSKENQTGNSKNSKDMEEKLEVSEIQKMQLEENTAQEKTRTYDISFKPTNWSDA